MAEVVGVSSAYLRRLLSQGRIEGVKVGGNWAVPRAEVRRFIEERRRT
jgi:excisionase family DNA binding protein